MIEYAAEIKNILKQKANRGTHSAEIIMGDVKWLELKAYLHAFLTSFL